MKRIFLLLIILSFFNSCDPYGPNKRNDIKKMEMTIKEVMNANKVEIIDEEDLRILVFTDYLEDEEDNELATSLVGKIALEYYKPNILDENKIVSISIYDSVQKSYNNKLKIRKILLYNKYFDIAFKDINEIFGGKSTNEKILEFYKNDCYKKMKSETSLEYLNINGIRQVNLTNPDSTNSVGYEIYVTYSGKNVKPYLIKITYSRKGEIRRLYCSQ